MQVGLSTTAWFLRGKEAGPLAMLRRAAQSDIDHLQVGDHVSFHDGTGFDGMVLAAASLVAQPTLAVHVGLFLLALRHPVTVARQMAEIARLAPGRLTLGVGVGGEDRHEFEICGIDPRTRGRRTDESLELLRQLITGEQVDHDGTFYQVARAIVAPAPDPEIPIVIGGRSGAALRRTARFGDGWLGLWVSAQRYGAATMDIAEEAARCGRDAGGFRHGLNLWCAMPGLDGHGADRLAVAMESRYRLPFERFAKWCPVGDAQHIAEFVRAYEQPGCRYVTLVLHTPDPAEAIDQAAAVKAELASGSDD